MNSIKLIVLIFLSKATMSYAKLPRDKINHFAISGMAAMAITQFSLKHITDDKLGAFVIGSITTLFGGLMFEVVKPSSDAIDDLKADALGSVVGAGLTIMIDF